MFPENIIQFRTIATVGANGNGNTHTRSVSIAQGERCAAVKTPQDRCFNRYNRHSLHQPLWLAEVTEVRKADVLRCGYG